MILVDSNVPMYLIGGEHPHKVDARRLLERAVAEKRRLVTDAEVLQEVLHRYVAIDRRDAVQPCFEVLLEIVDEVLAIDLDTVEVARDIAISFVYGIALDPTGRFLYYVPGAHGGGFNDGSPVVQFDVKNGKKKVIAFLHPFYQDKLAQ